jgi:hypothetical protein
MMSGGAIKGSGWRLLAAMSAIGLGGCATESNRSAATDVFSAAYGSAEDHPRKLFISGHSLTDRPFPDYLAALADGAGRPLEWNMQHLAGSSLRMRTQGDGSAAWHGYRQGTDRDRAPIDVLDEFGKRSTDTPYDTLILNEIHTLLESLVLNDTIGHATDYEARFFASNPDGQTYVYAAWLNIDDLDDPANWIAYERAAVKAWQCTTIAINDRLAAKGRTRPVRLIPAAPALAALVAQAVSKEGVPGLSAATPRATMERLFTDDVHLTELGNYYIALISHVALYGELPAAPWGSDIDPALAGELQIFARRFMAQWRQEQARVPINCSQYLADQFTGTYLSYVRDAQWRKADGRLRAHYKWARFSIEWPRQLRSDRPDNPFRARVDTALSDRGAK